MSAEYDALVRKNAREAQAKETEMERLIAALNALGRSNPKSNKGLKHIGKGIAFAALCGSATVLEIQGYPAQGLWILVFVWVIFY